MILGCHSSVTHGCTWYGCTWYGRTYSLSHPEILAGWLR